MSSDFCIERALQLRDATEIFLNKLIDHYDVEIAGDPMTLTHEERVEIIREVLAAAEAREESEK